MSREASNEAILLCPGCPGDGDVTALNRTISLESCNLAPYCPFGLQCPQLRGPLTRGKGDFLLPPNPEKTGKTLDSNMLLDFCHDPCTGWGLPGVGEEKVSLHPFRVPGWA